LTFFDVMSAGSMPARGQVFSTPPKEVLDALLVRTRNNESEAEHPVCAWPIAARGDLTGERGLVALGGENPTGQRYLLAQRPGRHLGGMLALAGIAAMF
jgi:hypothetical protein